MRIIGAWWSPRRNVLVIECSCGMRIEHPADVWRVTCATCGERGHLEVLRERYLLEHGGVDSRSAA